MPHFNAFPATVFRFLAAMAVVLPALAASEPLVIADRVGAVSLNAGWDYFEQATKDPAALAAGDAPARVDLPHTWNATDPVDAVPGYRRDASWYRKRVDLRRGDEGNRFALYFEGANMTADVFVNGRRAGGHVGGYLGFEVDITDFLRGDGPDEILVRVDNGVNRDLIPSQKADFVLYGGLTRDVFLRIRPPSHLASVRIDTPEVSARSATVGGKLRVVNAAGGGDRFVVDLAARGPDGEVVSSARLDASAADGTAELDFTLPAIENPALWSPSSPALHTLVATLRSADGAELHRLEETFGLRWFGFADDGSFMLNGERLLLRGTHRHEEHAGLGAALPNELHRRDMEMIKAVGANFVRLAHYPQDPEVYRAADRLGLILWDELPWCRGGLGGEAWQRNAESMLREMIEQNRNHPSVFFWSLGNEIDWLPDFEGGGDEAAINDFLRHLNAIVHELDPSRLTALRKYYAGWDLVDVFSPSIWAGWYGGGYRQYEGALVDAMKKYPRLLHMEYGGSSHVGRHVWNPTGGDGVVGGQVSVTEMVNQAGVTSVAKAGDWSESYIVDLFDWHLAVSESLPGFAGNAQWAFKDFATPLRPENPIPYINQKGLVERDGKPKEAWWVFRSHWTEDPPFCHIYGHSWPERHGGDGASTRQIRVYCNTESAQLTVNGIALEEKTRRKGVFPAAGLTWDVKLEEGSNRLHAVGRSSGKEVASDTLEIRYDAQPFGKPVEIRLGSVPRPDGQVLIEAVVVDGKGRRVHSARERVYFSHSNPGSGGTLVTDQGTPETSAAIELANGRAAILFDPMGSGSGAVIEARTQNLKGAWIQLP